ncbi:MAG TPA: LysR family transcriptional regulator [Rubrivivax sp.]|nr:LysR family transcriptional regulator [Rubrivivax sp.]HRY87122.1 LysR family transcriptional regulator [Rubrivivax sp.]
MQDLNDMLLFARVVEARGFSEAARRMRSSKSRVSKAVARLEQSLGARLLNRSTRGLSTTEIGAAFYEHCARIADEAAQAAELASRLQSEPRGTLRISAPVAFGRLHVAPALAEYLVRHAGLSVDLTVTDRLVDLVEEGHDVAIRIAREPSLHLVARELAPVRRVICATPAYFRHHGVPATPHELQAHNCLHRTPFGAQAEWRLHGPQGEAAVRIKGSLRIDDDDTLAQAALSGLGIALLPTFIIGGDLQAGRLQAVLGDYVPLERRVYAVHLPNRHLPAKVRAFVELLRERFGPVPYWDRGVPGVSAGETQ